ncbi:MULTISPECIES: DUF3515 domain-containing protein [Arthrobacter]|uniref:DUF3515 domain-containing protein n=2 Tax=Arthrobacter TaxID=1663 RepID=A0ABU9KSW1_9MICC|nr:DUF3515 domain-containing protein [Arthrobacter sp. YJM1]MDP5228558.1 DUF3515 domain-containing protein [Arthrobacter sp. YJM1]
MRFPRFRSLTSAVILATGAVLALSACSSTVDVTAADDAANPACAPMMVTLPDQLADANRRQTNAQATAAWGDPSQVILRCGVTPPGPTTDSCVDVNGVDWVIKPGKDGSSIYTLTTFGRTPAVELLLDNNKISSATVLATLASPVAKIKATGKCVGQEDLKNLPTQGK